MSSLWFSFAAATLATLAFLLYRSREDMNTKSQLLPSPRESSAQSQSYSDAKKYLEYVKHNFRDNVKKYKDFLRILEEFKTRRLHTAGVASKVKQLFRDDDPELIIGFNTFLPRRHVITFPLEDEAPPRECPRFEEALDFVYKVKARFEEHDKHVYKSFLQILSLFRMENTSLVEVHMQVTTLFHGHPDLLEEFLRFLPESLATTSNHHHHASSTRNTVLKNHYQKEMTMASSITGKADVREQYQKENNWDSREEEEEEEESMKCFDIFDIIALIAHSFKGKAKARDVLIYGINILYALWAFLAGRQFAEEKYLARRGALSYL